MMQKWVKKSLYTLFSLLILILLSNYYIDSQWCFNHSNSLNNNQKGMNERQQKANYAYFTNKKFNTVLLGSSRTTYVNITSFKTMKVFNFSANGMRPKEYSTYIDFLIDDAKQPIENIILGLDFFGYLDYGLFMFDDAPSIVQTTQSPFYRYKMLLSFDALNNSFKNVRDALQHRRRDRYDRNLVKIRNYTKHSKESILHGVEIYSRAEYSGNPDKKFLSIMQNLKSKYSDKNFIIYTTPISSVLFKKLIEMGHYENYENWLRTLVSIYGSVCHFMYINSITKDYLHTFADSNHAYTDTDELIIKNLENKKCVNSGFGMRLTKENIEDKLLELRKLNGVK